MALVVKDRVKVYSSTTGTGTLSLGSAFAGFQTFNNALGDGDTTYYGIFESSTGNWEVGLGTYTSSGNTLSRDTILESSNAGAAINLTADTEVFITYPADKSVYFDANGDVNLNRDPQSALQAATKQYVDTIAAAGIHYHDPVRVESPDTAGNLTATYDNGSSGVGATLTNSGTQAALVIDGVTVSTNDRVLIYSQTNGYENGVYTVTNTGSASTNWVLTRATDADSYGPSDPDSFGQGDAFFVKEGDTGAGELYVMNTPGEIVFGTTDINFIVVAETAVYIAGDGLTLSGTEFNVGAGTGITVNATTVSTVQDIATSATPTFDGLNTTGNITFGDNDQAIFGADNDFSIRWDEAGSSFSIVSTTSKNVAISTGGIAQIGSSGAQAQFNGSVTTISGNTSVTLSGTTISTTTGTGGVTLDHNGSAKLATTSTGVDITGTLTSDGLTVEQSGNDVSIVSRNTSNNASVATSSSLKLGITSTVGTHDSEIKVVENAGNSNTTRMEFYNYFGGTLYKNMSILGNGDISFFEDTGATAKFFWDASAESLGIGTTSPDAGNDIHIKPSSGNAVFALEGNAAEWWKIIGGTDDKLYFQNETDSNVMVISDANVGIGTSSPSATIALARSSNFPFIHWNDSSNNTIAFAGWHGGTGGGDDFRIGTQTTKAFSFHTNSSEAMRIDSSGNLLVGTTSNIANVDSSSGEGIALSSGSYGGFIGASRASDIVAILNRQTSDGEILLFRKDGTNVGSIGTQGGDLVIGTTDTGIKTHNGVDAIVPYNTSTNSARDASIDLGYSTNRFKDLYLSGQANVPKIDLYQQTNAHVFSVESYQTVYGPPSGGWNSGTIAHTFNSHDGTAIAQLGIGGSSVDLTSRFFGDVSISGSGSTMGGTTMANASLLIGTTTSGMGIDSNEIMTAGDELHIGGLTGGIRFRVGSTQHGRMDSSGNFGFGTTSPAQKVHVNGGQLQVTNGGTDVYLNTTATNSYIYTSSTPFDVYTSGTQRVRFGSTGYLSILGGSAPETHAYLNIGSSGNGQTRAIDIDGGWSANESKAISFTYGAGSANVVGQWDVQHNGPESRMRWGKLYHAADSSTYTMELVSTSTTTADLYVNGGKVWHQNNDGSGSGLDADTVDGIEASSFLRSDAADTATGSIEISTGTSQPLKLTTSSGGPWAFEIYRSDLTSSSKVYNNGGYWSFEHNPRFYNGGTQSRLLHTGDEGSGNGLDADTVDGIHASSFLRSDANDSFTGVLDAGSGNATAYRFNGRSFSWNSAMQSPNSYIPHVMQQSYSGWDPVLGIKTTNGFWQFGAYSSDILHLGYMSGAFGSHSTNAFDNSLTISPSTMTFNGNTIMNTGNYPGASYVDVATGNYGTIKIDDDRGVSWAGYAIRDDWVFMSSGAGACGIYNDTDNEWAIYCAQNSYVQLRYNNSTKFETTSGGIAVTGAITATGDITAYYSDERLKNFEGKIEGALDKVSQLNGYYFRENDKAKELGYENDARQVGVSAQEVEAVMPEVIKPAPVDPEYKTVQYEKLVPLLIEAIKELKEEVRQLKEGKA